MHIAICDNEPLAAETLKRQIESLNTKQDIEIYMSIDVFFAAVRSGTKFDLVFFFFIFGAVEWVTRPASPASRLGNLMSA